MSIPWLTLVTFLPLVGALVIGFSPLRWARQLALAFSLATWVVSLLMAVNLDPGAAAGTFQLKETADWIPVFGIQYKLGVDGLSLALVVLTTTLTWISILASFGPIQVRVKEYMISFLILEVGMLGVFLALDTFLFYIFWEVVLVPMYLIIGIWGGANRIYATIKFVLYTLVGSLLMLVAILATAFAYQGAHGGAWAGAFDFEALRAFAATTGFADGLQLLAFAAFFLAFAIKVPMFPFHTWLPDAHVEAPTAGSVILASVLLKMGAYGFVRFSLPMLPDASQAMTPLIAALSIIAIIYGAYMALAQVDLKKLIAYSSVSHMGFVTLGLFVMNQQGIEGAVLQMVNHGITTGALFLCVGIIYERTHSRLIADNVGLAKPMPRYATLLVIFALSSLGLPGTNSFVGEFLVLVGTFLWSKAAAALASLGVILAAAYLLYMIQRVVFGVALPRELPHLKDIGLREFTILLPLVGLVFWIGVYPNPLVTRMHSTVTKTLETMARTKVAPNSHPSAAVVPSVVSSGQTENGRP